MSCQAILRTAAVAAITLIPASVQAATIRVPGDAATIQGAINIAVNGDEVLIAEGTYLEQINLLGKAITVRGDGCNLNTMIDGTGGTPGFAVITCESGEGPDTVIANLTVINGDNGLGGGMRNADSSPTVMDCRFENNESSAGGAVFNHDFVPGGATADPTFIRCDFIENFTGSGGVGGAVANFTSHPTFIGCLFANNNSLEGGAVANAAESSATFTDCRFVGNAASTVGGAMANFNSSPTIDRCEFRGSGERDITNDPDLLGGAIFNGTGSDPLVLNTLFAGNSGGWGGGIYSDQDANPVVINCTFASNRSLRMFMPDGGAFFSFSSDVTVTNSILWSNTPNAFGQTPPDHVTYSIVQGGYPGEGNLSANPQFVDALGGDYRVPPSSPARNAGSNAAVPPGATEDLPGNPRIDVNDGNTVDMGAYECVFDPCTGRCLRGLVDCNGNGIHDTCDISEGTSEDCNNNLVPDECEAGGQDIVFLVDGSGSIDEEAFALQIGGIIECLCGPAPLIPADGSSSVTVIQFSSSDCPEVPLTVVDSPATAAELCSRIGAVEQVPGATNLVTALDRAAAILAGQGIGVFREVIISTDGDFTEPDDEVLEGCDRLRGDVGSRICIGIVDGSIFPIHEECANAGDDPDPTQQQGTVQVLDDTDGFAALCETCIETGDANNNGTPDECETCAGDIDLNGVVDFADVLTVLADWGDCPPPPATCPADVDGDGTVGFSDLLAVLAGWGPCPRMAFFAGSQPPSEPTNVGSH